MTFSRAWQLGWQSISLATPSPYKCSALNTTLMWSELIKGGERKDDTEVHKIPPKGNCGIHLTLFSTATIIQAVRKLLHVAAVYF